MTAYRDEIARMHDFFVAWVTGAAPRDDAYFDRHCRAHFDPRFQIIQPSGTLFSLDAILDMIRGAHGSNTDFAIEVEDVTVCFEQPGVAVVTYIERQRNAVNSTPPDNARLSTAVFRTGPELRWLHVHETALPAQ